MVVFPILSFIVGGWMMGWASAPYDPFWAQRHPRRAAWMALAGPGANLALAILAALLIHAGIWMGVFTHPASANFTHIVEAAKPGVMVGPATVLSVMFSFNCCWAFSISCRSRRSTASEQSGCFFRKEPPSDSRNLVLKCGDSA